MPRRRISASGFGVVGSGGTYAFYGLGNSAVTGTKSALVPAENGTHRTLYCVESPDCWFEDFGRGTQRYGTRRRQSKR